MKFIQITAYECDGMLAFTHKEIEANLLENAYDMMVDIPKGFRNWYIIPILECDE